MSENAKQPWDRTKWLLLIAILMIVEGFVFYAAMENSNSSSALGYISFAGTVTSIILAVLAIIYGFVQNGSQERKSEIISEQMGRVKEVVDALQKSKSSLGGELEKFEQIANKLEILSDHSKSTKLQIQELNNNLENLHQDTFAKLLDYSRQGAILKAGDDGGNTISKPDIVWEVAYLIKKASENNIFDEFLLSKVFQKFVEAKFKKAKIKDDEQEFLQGFSVASWLISVSLLSAANIVEQNKAEGKQMEIVIKDSKNLNTEVVDTELLDQSWNEFFSKEKE